MQNNLLVFIMVVLVVYIVVQSLNIAKSQNKVSKEQFDELNTKKDVAQGNPEPNNADFINNKILDNIINKTMFDGTKENIGKTQYFSPLFVSRNELHKSVDAKKPGPFKVISNHQYYLDNEHFTQYLPHWSNVTKTNFCRDDTLCKGTKCLII